MENLLSPVLTIVLTILPSSYTTTPAARPSSFLTNLPRDSSLPSPPSSPPSGHHMITFEVLEEEPGGTYVGDLRSDRHLLLRHGPSILPSLRFLFLTRDHPHQGYFRLDAELGRLTTSRPIDRETVCPELVSQICVLQLSVTVRPVEYFEIIRVRIRILDVNDHVPVFGVMTSRDDDVTGEVTHLTWEGRHDTEGGGVTVEGKRLEVRVSEGAVPHEMFQLPVAYDPDEGRNGVVGYILRCEGEARGMFELVGEKGDDGRKEGVRVRLLGRLDRERIERYSVRLEAEDGGTPPNVGILEVDIVLLDVNDNAPRFTYVPPHPLTIPENTSRGKTLGHVTAVDEDEGENGRVSYSLFSDSGGAGGGLGGRCKGAGLFEVGVSTGELILNGVLDYETCERYTIRVVARDAGVMTSLTSHVIFQVQVIDVNDNPPIIVVNPLTSLDKSLHSPRDVRRDQSRDGVSDQSHDDPEVRENSPPGTVVAHISVEDPDSGAGGRSVCVLSDYHLLTPSGVQPTRSVQDFYHLSLPSILTASSEFGLVAMSGLEGEYKLTTLVVFDLETTSIDPERRLILTCTDQGNPSLTSYAQIRVRLLDENDVTPSFDHDSYSVSVTEGDNVIGRTLLLLTATDGDVGVNNRHVTYSIYDVTGRDGDTRGYGIMMPVEGREGREEREGREGAVLGIEEGTGEVRANIIFDREKCAEYSFIVVATDGGTPPLSSRSLLFLSVDDVNDESPSFPVDSYTFGTFEEQPGGTEVGTVEATDRDHNPEYARIQYEIVGGESTGFGIDPLAGVIRSLRSLDRERVSVHRLTVIATNPGYPSLIGQVRVSIIVADINDHAPRILFPPSAPFPSSSAYQNSTDSSSIAAIVVYITPSSSRDHVTTVLATDDDVGINARLIYSMISVSQLDLALSWEDGVYSVGESNDTPSITLDLNITDPSDLFEIDPVEGSITTSRTFHQYFSAKDRPLSVQSIAARFLLTIRVSDNGRPSLSSIVDLIVVVNNTISAAPSAEWEYITYGHSAATLIVVVIVTLLMSLAIIVGVVTCVLVVRRWRQNSRRSFILAHMEKKTLQKIASNSVDSEQFRSDSNHCNSLNGGYSKNNQMFLLNNIRKKKSVKVRNDNAAAASTEQSHCGGKYGRDLDNVQHLAIAVPLASEHKFNSTLHEPSGSMGQGPSGLITEPRSIMTSFLSNQESIEDEDNSDVTDSGRGQSEEGDMAMTSLTDAPASSHNVIITSKFHDVNTNTSHNGQLVILSASIHEDEGICQRSASTNRTNSTKLFAMGRQNADQVVRNARMPVVYNGLPPVHTNGVNVYSKSRVEGLYQRSGVEGQDRMREVEGQDLPERLPGGQNEMDTISIISDATTISGCYILANNRDRTRRDIAGSPKDNRSNDNIGSNYFNRTLQNLTGPRDLLPVSREDARTRVRTVGTLRVPRKTSRDLLQAKPFKLLNNNLHRINPSGSCVHISDVIMV